MRGFSFLVCLFVAHTVLAVPTGRQGTPESDEIEQELIRHHHSTNDEGAIANSETNAQGQRNTEFDAASASVDNNADMFDDESIYDFTVADVLADIIYELKKNPVLLEQLIESEREKVEQRIEEMNLARHDSYGDDLSNFQKTAEQLQNEPKRVEKKVGRSGMAVVPGTQPQKRTQEVIDGNYERNDVSQETRDFQDFLESPREGGIHNDMNDESETDGEVLTANSESDNDNEDKADMTLSSEAEDAITNYDLYQWMQHLPKYQRNYFQGQLTQGQNAQPDTQHPIIGQESTPQKDTDLKENELSWLENNADGSKQNDQQKTKMS